MNLLLYMILFHLTYVIPFSERKGYTAFKYQG